jgi:hypothetical protein
MEYWLAVKIHDVDNNREVKFVIVVLNIELEPTRRLCIYLVLVVILGEILVSVAALGGSRGCW